MSAPLEDKFQDHYAVLGVDPKATSETIQGAYLRLAPKFHPKNVETGDVILFEAVNRAYEILSDPQRRKEFDRLQGIGAQTSDPQFSGIDFFAALERETSLRTAVLCLLYDRRRTQPSTPSLSMRQVEIMMKATAVDLSAALWYLKQRNLVSSDDRSSLQITVDGMDFLINKKPLPEDVLPFIKPAAMIPQKRSERLIAADGEGTSVLSTLGTLSAELRSDAVGRVKEPEHTPVGEAK
ncbi:MAG: J domain-containing protein [Bryobacterales bacterium]|nr:J domain-containing protein [Bryobacterales bacterium]